MALLLRTYRVLERGSQIQVKQVKNVPSFVFLQRVTKTAGVLTHAHTQMTFGICTNAFSSITILF